MKKQTVSSKVQWIGFLSLSLLISLAGCSKLDPERNLRFLESWKVTIGGSMEEEIVQVLQSKDGNFVVVGMTESLDGLENTTHGDMDICVMKYTSTGDLIWQYAYGGFGYEDGLSMCELSNGYLIAGGTNSDDGDVDPDLRRGGPWPQDIWLIKLDSYGRIQKQRCFGGTQSEWSRCLQQTNDNGFILSGVSSSTDFDVTVNHGAQDFWVLKLSSNLDIEWQKSYGGSNYDDAYVIRQTPDGGYIVGGSTTSEDQDVPGQRSWIDVWVMKLTANGGVTWSKTYGGNKNDEIFDLIRADNGDYVMVGYSESEDIVPDGSYGSSDGWVVRINSSGDVIWNKILGGSGADRFRSILQLDDGNFLVAGYSASQDGDVSINHGNADIWVVKLSSAGELLWEKTLGGSESDYGIDIIQTDDGEFVVAGNVKSNNGDILGNHGDFDMWIMKFAYIE